MMHPEFAFHVLSGIVLGVVFLAAAILFLWVIKYWRMR